MLSLVLSKVQLLNDQKVVIKSKETFNLLSRDSYKNSESNINEISKLIAAASSPSIFQKNAAVIKMTLMFFMWYAFNAGYNGKTMMF